MRHAGLLVRLCRDSGQLQLTLCNCSHGEEAQVSRLNMAVDTGVHVMVSCPMASNESAMGIRVKETRDRSTCFALSLHLLEKAIQVSSDSAISLSCITKEAINPNGLIDAWVSLKAEHISQSISAWYVSSLMEQEELFSEVNLPYPQAMLSFSSLSRLKLLFNSLLSSFSRDKKQKMRVCITATAPSNSDDACLCSLSIRPCFSGDRHTCDASITLHSGQEMQFVAVPRDSLSQSYGTPPASCSTVVVSAQDLYHVLHCDALAPASVLFGFSDQHALIVYVHWTPATMTFVLPSSMTE